MAVSFAIREAAPVESMPKNSNNVSRKTTLATKLITELDKAVSQPATRSTSTLPRNCWICCWSIPRPWSQAATALTRPVALPAYSGNAPASRTTASPMMAAIAKMTP